jgi:hypothetical protein
MGLLFITQFACVVVRPGDGDDDDSAANDDDAADDDDATDDDDVLGDDDDAADDDDDAADDDDDMGDDDDSTVEMPFSVLAFQMELNVVNPAQSTYGLGGTFTFIYYETYDQTTQVEYCREVIEFEAVAQFGSGTVAGCNNCTGQISIDETLVDNVTNQAIDPTHCDATWVNADADGDGLPDNSYGWLFVTSPANGGAGDFLNLGLIDYNTFSSLGLTADSAGTTDALTLATPWQGMDVTHFAYVNAQPGSFAEQSGLSTVAAAAGAGSDYHFYFTVAKNPTVNSHNGTDMVGEYVGGAQWIITFQ